MALPPTVTVCRVTLVFSLGVASEAPADAEYVLPSTRFGGGGGGGDAVPPPPPQATRLARSATCARSRERRSASAPAGCPVGSIGRSPFAPPCRRESALIVTQCAGRAGGVGRTALR